MTTPDFSYSGDPSESSLDEVRFLVQDTDPSVPLLTDTELTYLLGKWLPLFSSVTYVAAVAAAVIARKYAGVVDISADGVSVSTAGLSDRYRAIAEQLRDEYAEEGSVGGLPLIDNILADTGFDYTLAPLEFGLHEMDNPLAGKESYGGAGAGPTYSYDEMAWRW